MKIQRGVAALLTVLILSALLSAFAIYAEAEVWLVRKSVSEEYLYRASIADAWSCAYFAFSRLATDPERFTDISTTTVSFYEKDGCKVFSAHTTGAYAEVFVQGHSGTSFVDMRVTANRVSSTSPYQIQTWELL